MCRDCQPYKHGMCYQGSAEPGQGNGTVVDGHLYGIPCFGLRPGYRGLSGGADVGEIIE